MICLLRGYDHISNPPAISIACEEQVHSLQQSDLALPQGEGPRRGNSRQCFVGAFWDVVNIQLKAQTRTILISDLGIWGLDFGVLICGFWSFN